MGLSFGAKSGKVKKSKLYLTFETKKRVFLLLLNCDNLSFWLKMAEIGQRTQDNHTVKHFISCFNSHFAIHDSHLKITFKKIASISI